MNILKDKKKLIQILFGLAFLFLVANIVIDKLIPNHYTPVEMARSATEINHNFRLALSNYGMLNSWIKKEKRSRNDDDSLLFKYQVDVPKDLPIALLLDEIYHSFSSGRVIINSKEIKIGGETLVRILSGDNLKLQASFNYKDDITRNAGMVGFLVIGINIYNEIEINKFLRSSEKFTLLINPSIKNKDLIKKIVSDQKEAAIKISDEATDLDYKMKAGYSSKRIQNCIRSISADFANAAFLVLDNTSGLYTSPQMEIIKDELDKRNIKYFNMGNFENFLNLDDTELANYFKSELGKIKANGKLTLLISPEQFYLIHPEIVNFRKAGYKFVRVSQILLAN
ncbi:MAG TPA: hypothetical protein VKA26_15270 [Ignavibacteriaceae bacterium]|nr:hypothetical protein [Ignavibacteriaceae bacterium]